MSGDHDDPIVISSPGERRSEKRGGEAPKFTGPHNFSDLGVGTWECLGSGAKKQETGVYNRRICILVFPISFGGKKKLLNFIDNFPA